MPRTFTVALVGGDGAGKTAVARRLEASGALRCKYLYMGQSVVSGNAALPTTRLARWVKLRRAGGDASREAVERDAGSLGDPHYRKRKRSGVRVAASLLNRLAEAWWRQLISVAYRMRGYVVIYDRHFLVESAVEAAIPGAKAAKRVDRFEHWLLRRVYPRPDLLILLDAPPEVLHERKGDVNVERLAARRAALLEHGPRLAPFRIVDARPPLDEVVAAVRGELVRFAEANRARLPGDPSGAAARRLRRPPAARPDRDVRQKAPAVVVGLDHLNGIQTARILAGHGVPVIAVARDPRHYCCRTRVCDRILYVDTASEELVEALEQLGPTLDEKGVLFPCTDMQVLLLSRHRERLQRWYHLLLPAPEMVETLMDKVRFYTFAQENGFPIPPTVFLRSPADAQSAGEELRFPLALKPPMSAHPAWEGSSALKAYIIATPDQLLAAYDRFAPLADALIVQEWIEGPTSNLYSCNCYFDRDSNPLATFVSRKLRQWPAESGESSLGEECRNDVVLQETLRLFRHVRLQGLGYLEMKRRGRTAEHYIIEPNIGRPTGRSPIAEAGGVELIYTMYCDALGLPLPGERIQRYGRAKWVDIRRDTQSAVYQMRAGTLTPRQWLRSLQGPKRHAIFSWSDPGPFIGDLQRALRLFLTPSERRRRDYRTAMAEATGGGKTS